MVFGFGTDVAAASAASIKTPRATALSCCCRWDNRCCVNWRTPPAFGTATRTVCSDDALGLLHCCEETACICAAMSAVCASARAADAATRGVVAAVAHSFVLWNLCRFKHNPCRAGACVAIGANKMLDDPIQCDINTKRGSRTATNFGSETQTCTLAFAAAAAAAAPLADITWRSA